MNCPHCDKVFSLHAWKAHVPRCLWQPGRLAGVRELIRTLAAEKEGEYLRDRYNAARSPDMPMAKALCRRFGSWVTVCKWAGVGRPTCPHCQRPIRQNVMPKHLITCMANEEVRAAVREFIRAHPNRHGRMPSEKEYERLRPPHFPGRATVRNAFGIWDKVAEWAGMRRPEKDLDEPGDPYDWNQVLEDCPLQGMNVLRGAPAVREVRQWCIRTHSYRVVGTVPVMVLR